MFILVSVFSDPLHVTFGMKLTSLPSLVLLFCGLSSIVVIPALFTIWKRTKKKKSKPDFVLFFPEKSFRKDPTSSSVSRLLGVLNSAQHSLDVCVYMIYVMTVYV